MKPNFITLDSEKHKSLKLADGNSYSQIKDENLAPLTIHEFVRVSANMPIVFIPTGQENGFRAVAMMGLAQEENLFVGEDSVWDGIIVPESATIYPFGLANDEKDKTKAVLSFDENSDRFTEDGEGRALFNDDGTLTEFHNDALTFIRQHWENMQMTMAVLKQFAEQGLLKPFGVALNRPGETEPYTIDGFHIMDEDKLQELSTEDFDTLRKRGLLPAIYAQLTSMQQFNALARRKFAPK
ncbi:hypothetical protein GCM10017044_14760 [Kordiimonas sediminis]|uniref:Multidrug transporter n=1 Tax=Kordiimonas sediminis TaxID=1735581 RepID=A0A919AS61_9PROT|nr:SapC family protein [Kordiimonas sediminis]GHF20894.1 hypothetical protein GCM10017044_14760 [Kordiimonas sediminis]